MLLVGHETKEESEGILAPRYCDECQTQTAWELVKRRKWLRLYFQSVLPLHRKRWYARCEYCHTKDRLETDELDLAKEMATKTRQYEWGELTDDEYADEISQFWPAVSES
jgi:hypothetical protein